jgi:hypothetical protein
MFPKHFQTKILPTVWLGFLALIVGLVVCGVCWAQCTATLDCGTCLGVSGTISCSEPSPPQGCQVGCSANCPGVECCMRCKTFNRCNIGCCTISAGLSPNFFCNFALSLDAARSALAPEAIKASYFSTRSRLTDQAIENAGASPEIRIEVPSELPIQISNVTPVLSKNGSLQAITYEITNQGISDLVGWRVIWAVYVGGGPKPVSVVANETDTWYGKESDHLSVGAGTSGRVCVTGSAAPVTLLRGSVDYAEYTDGTRLGAAAEKEFLQLQGKRLARLKVYSDSLKIYNARGEQGLAAWLAEAATTVYRDETEIQDEARAARTYYLASDASQYVEQAKFIVDKAARQKMIP